MPAPQAFRFSEFRGTEFRVRKSWTHHNPKTVVVEGEVRAVPVAVGTASVPLIVPVATAAQHAQNIVRSIKLLSSVSWVVRISKVRLLTVLPPQTPCPLPHIPGHILTAVRLVPLGKQP